MAGMARYVAPASMEAWRDYDFESMRLSRLEVEALSFYLGDNRNPPPEMFQQLGMSKREIEEFGVKLKRLEMRVPSPTDSDFPFELDLSQGKPPSFFLERAQAAVPDIDKSEGA